MSRYRDLESSERWLFECQELWWEFVGVEVVRGHSLNEVLFMERKPLSERELTHEWLTSSAPASVLEPVPATFGLLQPSSSSIWFGLDLVSGSKGVRLKGPLWSMWHRATPLQGPWGTTREKVERQPGGLICLRWYSWRSSSRFFLNDAGEFADSLGSGEMQAMRANKAAGSEENRERDLRRKLLKTSKWPPLYLEEVRFWSVKNKALVNRRLAFLLPHELLAVLSEVSDHSVLCEAEALDASNQARHEHIRKAINGPFVSLSMWGDGIPFSWDRKRSADTWTLSLSRPQREEVPRCAHCAHCDASWAGCSWNTGWSDGHHSLVHGSTCKGILSHKSSWRATMDLRGHLAQETLWPSSSERGYCWSQGWLEATAPMLHSALLALKDGCSNMLEVWCHQVFSWDWLWQRSSMASAWT